MAGLALAEAINTAYNPPAVWIWQYGAYFTACNARAPYLAIIINGVKFFINPIDLIYRDIVDPLTNLCMTGVSSGGAGPYIIGDVFLQNAMAIFDVGNSKMRFIGRTYY
jgi:hypothetical protein